MEIRNGRHVYCATGPQPQLVSRVNQLESVRLPSVRATSDDTDAGAHTEMHKITSRQQPLLRSTLRRRASLRSFLRIYAVIDHSRYLIAPFLSCRLILRARGVALSNQFALNPQQPML